MSVEFDPVRVRRRRRLDPVVLGIGIVVVGVAVAVAKPWEGGREGSVAEATPAASTVASGRVAAASPARPSAARASSAPIGVEGPPLPQWPELAPVLGSHRERGVLAVTGRVNRFTASGADVGFAATWVSADRAADGVRPNRGEQAGAVVLGIGLTFRPGEAPRDVRLWLERSGRAEEWIDVVSVVRPAIDDPIVLMRLTPTGAVEPFEAGRYRLDLLRDRGVDRIVVGIPDRDGTIPDPSPWPITQSRLVPAAESDPSAIRFGLFATVDGFAVSLPVAESRPLGELDAWNVTREEPAPGAAPAVVRAFLPRATGLGVMLTSLASVQLADLSRLAPGPLVPVPPVRGGISAIQGRTPFVIFDGPGGRALEPGVYALSVSWTDAGGLHAGTWHVELRPGPVHRKAPCQTARLCSGG